MKHIVSRMSSYFPNRWPLSYLNLTKTMKTHIRRQQHKKNFKHQDIKQKEPPQKYRLGTISNTKLLAGLNRFYRRLTSPSASAVVHITDFHNRAIISPRNSANRYIWTYLFSPVNICGRGEISRCFSEKSEYTKRETHQ